MQWLIGVLLANAVGAGLLAVAVFGISRLVHRPPLLHMLWVLVLVKLVTPPLLVPSLQIPAAWRAVVTAAAVGTPGFEARSADLPLIGDPAGGRDSRSKNSEVVDSVVAELPATDAFAPRLNRGPPAPAADSSIGPNAPSSEAVGRLAAEVGSPAAHTSHARGHADLGWLIAFVWRGSLVVWFSVAAMWCLAQVVSTLRFRSYLANSAIADPACDLQVAAVVERMGLKSRPRVRLLEGILSPMLWGLGSRAMILIPRKLFAEMSSARCETLIAHELAHFQRGDQWVRLLELVATTVFWWHPAVWWARREIEIAEEESCDAWVVQHCRGTERTYAEALLETVDFVAEGGRHGPAPIAASGIGHAPLLRKRLKTIMSGGVVTTVSLRGRFGVGLCACLALPASPLFDSRVELRASPTPFRNGPVARAVVEPVGDGPTPIEQTIDGGVEQTSEPLREPDLPWASARSRDRSYSIDVRRGYQTTLRNRLSGAIIAEGEYTCVAFSPSGSEFVAGSGDGAVRLIDSATGDVIRSIDTLAGSVHSVAYSPDGGWVVATGAAGAVAAYDLASPQASAIVLAETNHPVRCVRFSPDGSLIAFVTDTWLSSEPARVEIIDFGSRSPVASFGVLSSAGALEFVGRERLLVASWSGVVWQLAAANGAIQAQVRIPKDLVSSASFSVDTRALDAALAALEQIDVL